jgi:hypothetical protein
MSAVARQAEAYLRTGAVPKPGRLLRLAVWIRRRRLDAELAAGWNPLGSPALALRARQLAEPAQRRCLATAIERALDLARRPAYRSGMIAPCRLDAAAERDLRYIALRLRTSGPIGERGAAIVSKLISDGTGPLYNPAISHRLRDQAVLALRCLD